VTGALLPLAVSAAVACLVSGLVVPTIGRWARRRGLLDRPNARSSHSTPTPRLGGVGIVAGIVGGFVAVQMTGGGSVPDGARLLAGALALAGMSLADDLRPLPPLIRLTGQLAVAVWLVGMLEPVDGVSRWWPGGVISGAVALVWVVGLVNAYNFMDGIDGLAGGQALVAGLGWLVVGLLVGDPLVAAGGLVMAAAVVPFLWLNWQPASIFMGDSGSAVLGLCFALLPLLAGRTHPHMLLVGGLLVWPFIFDTAFTFVRRLRRGENVTRAHRTHLYQRLVATGRSHAHVTIVYVGLAALALPPAMAIAADRAAVGLALTAPIALGAAGLWWGVARRERSRLTSSPAVAAGYRGQS
jgi:UDP-N-acetylmuramyl pentapeptide phosphotransferase/UDP-N-acetylglucosamine-1-phosphate transferase